MDYLSLAILFVLLGILGIQGMNAYRNHLTRKRNEAIFFTGAKILGLAVGLTALKPVVDNYIGFIANRKRGGVVCTGPPPRIPGINEIPLYQIFQPIPSGPSDPSGPSCSPVPIVLREKGKMDVCEKTSSIKVPVKEDREETPKLPKRRLKKTSRRVKIRLPETEEAHEANTQTSECHVPKRVDTQGVENLESLLSRPVTAELIGDAQGLAKRE